MNEQQHSRVTSSQNNPDWRHGKLPPSDIETESALLYCLTTIPDSIEDVSSILTTEHAFYKTENQLIYKAILQLKQNNVPVDILTLVNFMKTTGTLEQAGGAYYLSQLGGNKEQWNYLHYAKTIFENYVRREIISGCSQYIQAAFDRTNDVFDLNKQVVTYLENTVALPGIANNRDITDIKNSVISMMKAAAESKGATLGHSSGLKELDLIVNGFEGGLTYVIAARPGMGKTSLVKSIARSIAIDQDKHVLIFELEMRAEQLIIALLSEMADINNIKLKKGNLAPHEWELVHNCLARIRNNMIIDDTPTVTIDYIRAKAKKLKKVGKLDMIIIDYIQLISLTKEEMKGTNREGQISHITRELKKIARELNVPVIELSQLSREVDKRTIPRPTLSDLRESGAIEQDADCVMFIFRPEYYKITQDDKGNQLSGLAEIIVAKNRSGPLDTCYVKWIKHITKFEDREDIPASDVFMPTSQNDLFTQSDDEPNF